MVKPNSLDFPFSSCSYLEVRRKQEQISRRRESEDVCADISPSGLLSGTGGKGGPR